MVRVKAKESNPYAYSNKNGERVMELIPPKEVKGGDEVLIKAKIVNTYVSQSEIVIGNSPRWIGILNRDIVATVEPEDEKGIDWEVLKVNGENTNRVFAMTINSLVDIVKELSEKIDSLEGKGR